MNTGIKILGLVAAVFGIGYFASNKKEKPAPTKIPDDKKPGLSSILFVGDSNTFYPWSYADQFKEKYGKIRNKKIAKIGAKTDWMLTELKKELAINRYDVICILGGSNDIYGGGNLETAKKNLLAMFNLGRSKGSITIGISPPSKDYFTRNKPTLNKILVDLLEWYDSDYGGQGIYSGASTWINFKRITSNKKYFNSSDGYLHPQKDAHTILLSELMGILKMSFK